MAVLALHSFEEHALGTVIGDQQLSVLQAIHHRRQERVVERLTALAQADVEAVVDLLEFTARLIAEQSPGLQRNGVAPLQLHHLVPGCGLEGFVLIEPLLGLAVERHQIAEIHGVRCLQRFGSHLLEVGDQHPELGAPVAHVIEAQHRMAAELQHPRQRVANDRGAQMPHMHLLGDVGAGEVHHHR